MNFELINKLSDAGSAALLVKVFAEGPDKNDCAELKEDALRLFKAGSASPENGKKYFAQCGRRRVIFIGCGKESEFTSERARETAGRFVREAKASGEQQIVLLAQKDPAALTEGALLASYVFDEFKTKKDMPRIKIYIAADRSASQQVKDAALLCANVSMARDLANTPSNVATPSYIAGYVSDALSGIKNLEVKVHDEKWIKKTGMTALWAVAKGSAQPPRFVEIIYRGDSSKRTHGAVIGKGITFDSGGISIKPQSTPLGGIEEMKFDMSGAAAVFAAVKSIAELKYPVNLNVYMPLTENLPDGDAYKPGDIIKTMAGITVEVISTDAEGRLILCDAIEYARQKAPDFIADIATLTGACSVTFGGITSGVMGNDPALVDSMKKAGDETGELVWELPLHDAYLEWIKGKYADIRNTGTVAKAGTITAGMFLKQFVKNTPWVHVDIAGTAYGITHKPYVPDTGSGMGARLFVAFLRAQSNKKNKQGDRK